MNDLIVLVYSMKGCPHCVDLKKTLFEQGVVFYDRDIDEHQEEYKMFVEATKSDLVPALMIIEGDEQSNKSFLYVPERDYMELNEAVDLVNNHRRNVGLIS
jgi:glutaredoxin